MSTELPIVKVFPNWEDVAETEKEAIALIQAIIDSPPPERPVQIRRRYETFLMGDGTTRGLVVQDITQSNPVLDFDVDHPEDTSWYYPIETIGEPMGQAATHADWVKARLVKKEKKSTQRRQGL